MDSKVLNLCEFSIISSKTKTKNFPQNLIKSWVVTDAYNNKRGRSPEVDGTSRQRRRYRNGDIHGRRNQIAAGYDRRNEEGYENKEFQTRDSQGIEKPKYSGPSAEDMLYGPCRIHYAYLDGKRVSNHQMKDCRTFLRLQNAMDSSQGARQGGKSMS
jgi:hypothetical protein